MVPCTLGPLESSAKYGLSIGFPSFLSKQDWDASVACSQSVSTCKDDSSHSSLDRVLNTKMDAHSSQWEVSFRSYISLTTNMRLKLRKAKFKYSTSFMGITATSPKGKYITS